MFHKLMFLHIHATTRSLAKNNTLRVNADHGRDDHPLADHMTKLRNVTKGEIREFSAFPFSLQLILDQTVTQTSYHVAVDTK